MTPHPFHGASRSSSAQMHSLIVWPSRGPLNIRLNKIRVLGADVDQDIAMATGRAKEMASVIVDLRRDGREFKANFAISTFPHRRLPLDREILSLAGGYCEKRAQVAA